MSQSKYWCFTLNNPTLEELEKITSTVDRHVEYLVFQLEKGEQGTEHVQGYVCFKTRKKMSTIKNLWSNRLALSVRYATHDQAKAYCMKEDTRISDTAPLEFGDDSNVPRTRGQRNDLVEIKEQIKSGVSIRIIEDEHFCQFARYGKYFHLYNDKIKDEIYVAKEKLRLSTAVLKTWQQQALIKLERQNDREILWIYDFNGGKGKSWLGRYLEIMKGAFLIQLSKKEDIAYAYNHEEIVIFDLTRSDKEFINYSLIESFKNGRLFSPKYESKVKRFTSAKVMILSNHEPDRTKLTNDRLTVVDLENWIF